MKSPKRSMADLARRLAERAAQQRAVDPRAAAAERRAALEAYNQARERRLIVGLSVAVAVTVGAGIAYLVSTVNSRPVPPFPSVAARPEPASSLERTSAAPAAASPHSPLPAAGVVYAPAVEAASATLPARQQPAPVAATPSDAPLERNDVREIQAKLRSFGFNPGPVDGKPGRMTEGAVRRYQRDGASLRPAKSTAAVGAASSGSRCPGRPASRPARRTAAAGDSASRPRRTDPFEPVRTAGNRFGQWMEPLTR